MIRTEFKSLHGNYMIRNKSFYALLFSFFFIAPLAIVSCSGMNKEFQKDADIVRLKHLKYYGELIEEYHKKSGKYPFESVSDVPLYVFVVNDKQEKYAVNANPNAHAEVSFKTFVNNVDSLLGRNIDEYYDPQYAPDGRPIFYIYMIYKDTYFFAIHLSQDFPFTKTVADGYYKVEISNSPNENNLAKSPKILFESPEFNEIISHPISKEGFFKEREAKYLHFTKSR